MMLSPHRSKMKQDNIRSPSIPVEIGPGGQNFHAYFLDDSGSERSSRLGISKPSYESPDKLDFSPVLQSRKSIPVRTKAKSALNKYQVNTGSQLHNNVEDRTMNNEAEKTSKQSKPEQAINSPFRSFRKKQRNRSMRKNEQKMARDQSVKNTAPLRNPIKALKFAKSSSSSSIRMSSKKVECQMAIPSGEESCSTIEMDGSIDLHKSVPTHHPNISSRAILDNGRFFTPVQVGLPSGGLSSQSSVSSLVSTDTSPLLTTHPLSSSARNQGRSLGITPPPRSSTTRIVVPYVKPSNSKSKNTYTIFVLLIQPSQKIFELVRLNYDPAKTTLRHIIEMIPAKCSEENLCNQVYTGLCRPNANSSSNKYLSNLSLTASVMARDGSCARIVCGEVLAAVPEGYTSKETQILARHIMKNPKMQKLLSKKNPLGKASRSSRSTKTGDNARKRNKSNGYLGIEPPMYNHNLENGNEFSSSMIFSPLTDTIVEDAVQENNKTDIVANAIDGKNRIRSTGMGKLAAKLERENERNFISGDNSCNSSLSSINSFRRGATNGPVVQHLVSNIEMKNKIQDLEYIMKDQNASSRLKMKVVEPLIVDEDEASKNKDLNQEVGLSVAQLNEIKREAAQAARVAAEEAFAKRMEELVHTLDVSDEEKNRLLENDDMSYHSAISFAMNGSFATLPKESCEFPVSVTVSQPQDPPTSADEDLMLSPHGSYGAFASELILNSPYAPVTSPYAPSPGVKLLAPLSASQKNNISKPLLSPLPVVYSPGTTDTFSPKPSDPLAFNDKVMKLQSSVNKTMNTTFTHSSIELDDDDIETSLLSETMEGFYNITTNAVSKFLDRRKKKLNELPSKILKQKLHLKVMSIVCLMYLSSQTMMHTNKEDDEDLNQILTFYNETSSSADGNETETKRSFSLLDLQQILFWFLLLSKGQNFLSQNKPKRRKRRAWKSRVVPVKHY